MSEVPGQKTYLELAWYSKHLWGPVFYSPEEPHANFNLWLVTFFSFSNFEFLNRCSARNQPMKYKNKSTSELKFHFFLSCLPWPSNSKTRAKKEEEKSGRSY